MPRCFLYYILYVAQIHELMKYQASLMNYGYDEKRFNLKFNVASKPNRTKNLRRVIPFNSCYSETTDAANESKRKRSVSENSDSSSVSSVEVIEDDIPVISLSSDSDEEHGDQSTVLNDSTMLKRSIVNIINSMVMHLVM